MSDKWYLTPWGIAYLIATGLLAAIFAILAVLPAGPHQLSDWGKAVELIYAGLALTILIGIGIGITVFRQKPDQDTGDEPGIQKLVITILATGGIAVVIGLAASYASTW